MTDHTLTETTEFTDEMVLALLNAWTGRELPTLDRYDHLIQVAARRALAAALAVDARPWEPLNGRTAHVGAEVRHEHRGTTTTGVVARVDGNGGLWTAEGGPIGQLGYGIWHVRRVAPELPTKFRTVIVPADGREYIEAEVDGTVWRTREAILGLDGRWHGVWRAGRVAIGSTSSDSITLDTWKEDDQ